MDYNQNIKSGAFLLFFALLILYKPILCMHKKLPVNLHIQTQNLKFKLRVVKLTKNKIEVRIIEVNPESIDFFLETIDQIKYPVGILLKNLNTKKISHEKIEKILNLLGNKILVFYYYGFDFEKFLLEKIQQTGLIIKLHDPETEIILKSPDQTFYKNCKFESNSDIYGLNGKTKSNGDLSHLDLEIEEPDDSPGDFGGSTPTNPWVKLKNLPN